MAKLAKLLPVVFPTVQFAVLLIVPVSEVVRAHRAPEETETVTVTQQHKTKQRKKKKGTLHSIDALLSTLPCAGRQDP